MGNRLMPSWLSPRIRDVLPENPIVVGARLGASIVNASRTPEQRSAFARKAAKAAGPSGGLARAAALSPERRSEIARNAALARVAKAGPDGWRAFCVAGGTASMAKLSKKQKRTRAQANAKATNLKRWGHG